MDFAVQQKSVTLHVALKISYFNQVLVYNEDIAQPEFPPPPFDPDTPAHTHAQEKGARKHFAAKRDTL